MGDAKRNQYEQGSSSERNWVVIPDLETPTLTIENLSRIVTATLEEILQRHSLPIALVEVPRGASAQ